ncbi:MAG: NAD(P)/FAD-dependent oxidoreductase [Byssovorax sp.]
MKDFDAEYDVAIIGGRPSGASLGARLGARGLRVLVVDRAEFPSLPAVPSCPTIHPGAMRLLDELGIDEAAYGDGVPKIRGAALEFTSYFTTKLAVPTAFGRDYLYGLDRRRFDFALWKHLERYPSVTARQGFAFQELIRDASGQVIGFEGRQGDGPVERIRAGWVIGADGRFSLVARKASAKVTEEHIERVSTVYYADWEGVAPFTEGEAQGIHIFVTGKGTDVLSIPVPEDRVMFATHQRADRVDIGGDAEAYYEGVLRSCPGVARRIAGARRATPVIGIKRIANRYLEPGGPGWALTGDALHHKDPVDGQGIYDALIETKVLAEAIAAQREGEKTWDEAITWYGRRVHEETHGMYLFTMDRLKRELYEEPPPIMIKTMMRWMLSDPGYQRDFFLCLSRAIPAEGWLTPGRIGKMMARGALQDLKSLWRSP